MNKEYIAKTESIHKDWRKIANMIIKIIESKILSKSEAERLRDLFVNAREGYYGGHNKYFDMLEDEIILCLINTYHSKIQTNKELNKGIKDDYWQQEFSTDGKFRTGRMVFKLKRNKKRRIGRL